ncbi:MAG TPA: methylated-DNA--[protein]-cysteine S-methyltransferase [Bacillota bacterium]|jgi:methylated-DNA-[protein]-cysteine S-methyltransferase|nr:methylated-DNA--[protein]-cysteine S-methyltransferase [Fastidiosipila sp.]HPX92578.1 methylated-DNA--[protein]-cysteine S-methyltransferase [Bacillota bacterium]HQB81154.1 methylated-DNA--[protein]-cysteine S-methyltransferase [Bacillota bacterium]
MLYQSVYDSPLGKLVAFSDGQALTGLWFEGQKYYGAGLEGDPVISDQLPVLMQAVSWLDRYFAGAKPQPEELLLDPRGSSFRQAVWKILLGIPYGETMTYGAIASLIARDRGLERMSSRAVGGAVGHNPISIVIPCHRVIGWDGSLTGFGGGLSRKAWLLEHERNGYQAV